MNRPGTVAWFPRRRRPQGTLHLHPSEGNAGVAATHCGPPLLETPRKPPCARPVSTKQRTGLYSEMFSATRKRPIGGRRGADAVSKVTAKNQTERFGREKGGVPNRRLTPRFFGSRSLLERRPTRHLQRVHGSARRAHPLRGTTTPEGRDAPCGTGGVLGRGNAATVSGLDLRCKGETAGDKAATTAPVSCSARCLRVALERRPHSGLCRRRCAGMHLHLHAAPEQGNCDAGTRRVSLPRLFGVLSAAERFFPGCCVDNRLAVSQTTSRLVDTAH